MPALVKQEPVQRQTLSLDEAARYLGVGRSTLYVMARDGELPTVQIRRRRLVPKQALDDLLKGAKRA
jgi:excisionase family DNA binding protein